MLPTCSVLPISDSFANVSQLILQLVDIMVDGYFLLNLQMKSIVCIHLQMLLSLQVEKDIFLHNLQTTCILCIHLQMYIQFLLSLQIFSHNLQTTVSYAFVCKDLTSFYCHCKLKKMFSHTTFRRQVSYAFICKRTFRFYLKCTAVRSFAEEVQVKDVWKNTS